MHGCNFARCQFQKHPNIVSGLGPCNDPVQAGVSELHGQELWCFISAIGGYGDSGISAILYVSSVVKNRSLVASMLVWNQHTTEFCLC